MRTHHPATFRKQDQQLRLLAAILERVTPAIRRDCNYADLTRIRREATWNEDAGRWTLPELQLTMAKSAQLPPHAANGIDANGAHVGIIVAHAPPPSTDDDDEDDRESRLKKVGTSGKNTATPQILDSSAARAKYGTRFCRQLLQAGDHKRPTL